MSRTDWRRTWRTYVETARGSWRSGPPRVIFEVLACSRDEAERRARAVVPPVAWALHSLKVAALHDGRWCATGVIVGDSRARIVVAD